MFKSDNFFDRTDISSCQTQKPPAHKGGADIEVLSHGISDAKSEVLWRFY